MVDAAPTLSDGEHLNEAQPATSPRSRRRLRQVLSALVLIAVVVTAIWYINYRTTGRFMQATDNAYIKADAVTVSPKVAGYVDAVLVAENQMVKAGQPLVRIDAGTYRAQADQSRAQIEIARATADGVRGQIGEQESAIDRARADLQAAQTDAAFAQAEVARYIPLAATGAETPERLAQLRNQSAGAAAKVRNAAAVLDSTQRRVTTLQAQVRQASAQAQSAEAQLRSANSDVGGAVIRASTDGRIGNKSVRVGQYVQAATRLMSIVPVAQLYVEANFKETQLGLMRVGQPVRIEVDALPDMHIVGRVISISPGTGAQFSVLPPQNATGNFTKVVQRVPVRIAMALSPQTRALLVPGMSIEATVDTRSARGAADAVAHAQEQVNDRTGK